MTNFSRMPKLLNKTTLLVVLLCTIVSCGNNDDSSTPPDDSSTLPINDPFAIEVSTEAIAEFIDDDIEKLVLFHLLNLAQSNEGGIIETHLPDDPFRSRNDCANHSVNETTGEIIIDFASGCEGTNGILRAGKITASFTEEENGVFKDIQITLDQYAVENIAVEGSRHLINNANSETKYGDINSSVNSGRLSFGDGTVYIYNSERSLSYTEAGGGQDFEDFSFLTKINKTGTNRAGISFIANSEAGLTYTTECFRLGLSLASAGILNLSIGDTHKSIDFGVSGCSGIVTATDAEGMEFKIDLTELIVNN